MATSARINSGCLAAARMAACPPIDCPTRQRAPGPTGLLRQRRLQRRHPGRRQKGSGRWHLDRVGRLRPPDMPSSEDLPVHPTHPHDRPVRAIALTPARRRPSPGRPVARLAARSHARSKSPRHPNGGCARKRWTSSTRSEAPKVERSHRSLVADMGANFVSPDAAERAEAAEAVAATAAPLATDTLTCASHNTWNANGSSRSSR